MVSLTGVSTTDFSAISSTDSSAIVGSTGAIASVDSLRSFGHKIIKLKACKIVTRADNLLWLRSCYPLNIFLLELELNLFPNRELSENFQHKC